LQLGVTFAGDVDSKFHKGKLTEGRVGFDKSDFNRNLRDLSMRIVARNQKSFTNGSMRPLILMGSGMACLACGCKMKGKTHRRPSGR
jgi:hypothetical protein